MKSLLVLLSLVGTFIYFSVSLAQAVPTCTFRSSCSAGEVCVFSVFQNDNSHVGNCSYYGTKICCTEITSVAFRSNNCNSDEGSVISLNQENNSHIGGKIYYSLKVCSKFTNNPLIGNIRTSCQSGEACVASVFQGNNSHVGTCNYYSSKICIRERFNATLTVNLNDTTPKWNGGVRVSGKITRSDSSNVDTDAEGINVYVNRSVYCTNQSDSNGDYTCDFTSPNAVGNYELNVTIQDPQTSAYWSNTTTFKVKAAVGPEKAAERTPESISCYEEPRIIQNPDGTLKTGYVRVCIFR